ncbi:MAG: rod shape-determining protein MreC [Hyphomicrobiaceae bacterium]|jgi:rod shape-determining protein MreC
MSTVRYDSYTRGALRRSTEAVSGLHFLLMFLAAGLLVLTRVDHPLVVGLQHAGRQIAEPVLVRVGDLAEPLRNFAHNTKRYFTVESELRRLERELASMQHLLKRTSSLAKRNDELSRLANLVRSSAVSAVTVEVIAGPKGLFSKSVQIGAGRRDGLRYGQPVFSGEGLFGRIATVGEQTASVLVLNDINSRIAVVVGQSQAPALLVGDNTERPRLIYVDQGTVVREGAAIVTSGASGEFPRGIKVGKAMRTGDDLRVATAASLLAGTYLTVLRYELPTANLDVKAAPEKASKAATQVDGNAEGSAQVVSKSARENKR